MTLSVIPDALVQRVTAHLNSIAPTRRIVWTGKGSIVVHFTTDLQVVSMDTRFTPLTVNWTMTFRSPDGAIYLNVPAAWRREGEGNVKTETVFVTHKQFDGELFRIERQNMKAHGSSLCASSMDKSGLIIELQDDRKGMIVLKNWRAELRKRNLVSADPAPILDPTAPLPVTEIENLDEPHDDIGTLVSDEAPLTLPDTAIVNAPETKPADPYAWATPERRAEVAPISEELMPIELEPTTEDGVWRIEDAISERIMRKGLKKCGVTILSVEEDVSVDEDTEGEPYTIARFSLGRKIETPYPSKRQGEPIPMENSIYAQYKALRDTLLPTTWLIIQVNGDEWNAFVMDANLLRRFAPLCRFAAQSVNQHGEQWDKLTIPARMIDETVTNANEAGITIALASIVRDEPGKLPVREVDEIHAPNEPVQYVGKEEPPTEWETEADADDEPLVEFAPIVAPMTPAPSEIEMTPALMAAKIKLRIHGGLRLGLIESVTPMPHDGWFAVTFVHGLTEAFTVPALKMVYEVGDVWRSKRTVYVREQSTTPHGTAIEQAAAVLENLSSLIGFVLDARELKAARDAEAAKDAEADRVDAEIRALIATKEAEARANAWQWPAGKSVTIYVMQYCTGAIMDSDEGTTQANYRTVYTLTDELDDRGYITVFDRGYSNFTQEDIRISPAYHKPTWTRLTLSALDDVPNQILTKDITLKVNGVREIIRHPSNRFVYDDAASLFRNAASNALPAEWLRDLVDRA